PHPVLLPRSGDAGRHRRRARRRHRRPRAGRRLRRRLYRRCCGPGDRRPGTPWPATRRPGGHPTVARRRLRGADPPNRGGRPMTALAALTRTEARLLSREWAAMLFAFVFPPATLLVLAGAFGDKPDEG